MSTPAYPWYQLVSGDDIEQGDILDACPVFLPPEDLAGHPFTTATFRWEERDVIESTFPRLLPGILCALVSRLIFLRSNRSAQ